MAYEAIYKNIGLVVWNPSSPAAVDVVNAFAAAERKGGMSSELVLRTILRSVPLLLNTIIECP